MSEAKFTPGPWEVCDPGDYGDFDGESRVVLGNDMRIAVVHWHEGDYRAENDANANLIAASPDLYDALREAKGLADMAVMSDDGDGTPSDDQSSLEQLRAKIDAALAKAEGRSL